MNSNIQPEEFSIFKCLSEIRETTKIFSFYRIVGKVRVSGVSNILFVEISFPISQKPTYTSLQHNTSDSVHVYVLSRLHNTIPSTNCSGTFVFESFEGF